MISDNEIKALIQSLEQLPIQVRTHKSFESLNTFLHDYKRIFLELTNKDQEEIIKLLKQLNVVLNTFPINILKIQSIASTLNSFLNSTKRNALNTMQTDEIIGISSEIGELEKKYYSQARMWLISSGIIFTLIILILTNFFGLCSQKNSISKDISTNTITKEQRIIQYKDKIADNNISKYINQNERTSLQQKLNDISPFVTKISLIFILASLGTITLKIFFSTKRLAEEYRHRKMLADNMIVGNLVFKGVMSSQIIEEELIIPSLKKILEDPIEKAYGTDNVIKENDFNKLLSTIQSFISSKDTK